MKLKFANPSVGQIERIFAEVLGHFPEKVVLPEIRIVDTLRYLARDNSLQRAYLKTLVGKDFRLNHSKEVFFKGVQNIGSTKWTTFPDEDIK